MSQQEPCIIIKQCSPDEHVFSEFNGEYYVCEICHEQITQADFIEK